MSSEEAAQLTAINRQRRQIIYAGKKRMIEVIQCSGEDMNLVLTHGIASPTLSPVTPIAHQAAMPTITHAPLVQRQIISPGRLTFSYKITKKKKFYVVCIAFPIQVCIAQVS